MLVGRLVKLIATLATISARMKPSQGGDLLAEVHSFYTPCSNSPASSD